MDTTKLSSLLYGILTSFTVWLGMIVTTLPDWWPLVQDQLSGLLGTGAHDKLVRIMGILVILMRFKTSQSLADKGDGK